MKQKKVIDLTGSKGLAKKWAGDFVYTGYDGYDQSGQPNLRYNVKDGQMAHGAYDVYIKNGYLSPAVNTITNLYNPNTIGDEVTACLVDDINKIYYFADSDYLYYNNGFSPDSIGKTAFSVSATEYRDMKIYYLNGVRTGFLISRGSSTNLVRTFTLTGGVTLNENWSSTDVTNPITLDQSYAASLLVSGDGFMYIFNKNKVHRVDGTTLGGTYGTLYKDILVGTPDTLLSDAIEYKNKIYIAVQNGYEQEFRGSTGNDTGRMATTQKGKIGIYVWNRQSTYFNSSDFIDLPGIAFVKNMWVSPSNKLYVMGGTSTEEIQILMFDGTKFIVKEVLPIGSDTNKRHALQIHSNYTYWLGQDGNIYRFGSEYGDEEDVLTIIGRYTDNGVNDVNPVVLVITGSQSSVNDITPGTITVPTLFNIIGEFESNTYRRKLFLPFSTGYFGLSLNSSTALVIKNEPHKGDIYTGVTLLPTLSTIQHVNIFMSPTPVTNDTCMDGFNNNAYTSAASFISGKWGNAISIDDTFRTVALPDNNLTRITGNFSISFWVNSNSLTLQELYSNHSRNTAWSGIRIYKDTSGFINFMIGKNTGTTANTDYKIITGTTNVTNTWAHVCATWDGVNMKLYVNGTQEATAAWANAPVYSDDYNYHAIGSSSLERYSGLNNHLSGLIDDVAIFTRVLTTGEITELQSAVLTSTSLNEDDNLLAYYPLDSDVKSYAKADLKDQREATIKFYANQSATPYMTKYVTRADIYKGYVSFEINKPYVNSFQMEIEYFNSTNLNNYGTFTPVGVCDFAPFYAELVYEPTTTLK